jgi:hypothetical protein
MLNLFSIVDESKKYLKLNDIEAYRIVFHLSKKLPELQCNPIIIY